MTALQLARRSCSERGKPLSELRSVMRRYPQVLVNVPVADKARLGDERGDRRRDRAPPRTSWATTGRVLVRASGTEPLVRVMAEAADEADGARRSSTGSSRSCGPSSAERSPSTSRQRTVAAAATRALRVVVGETEAVRWTARARAHHRRGGEARGRTDVSDRRSAGTGARTAPVDEARAHRRIRRMASPARPGS